MNHTRWQSKAYKLDLIEVVCLILCSTFFLTVQNWIENNGLLPIFLVQRFAPFGSSFCQTRIRSCWNVSIEHVFVTREKNSSSFHICDSSEKEKDPVLTQAGKQAAIASINVFNDVMDGKNVTDALLDR